MADRTILDEAAEALHDANCNADDYDNERAVQLMDEAGHRYDAAVVLRVAADWIDRAADEYTARVAEIAGVSNRGRDGMCTSGMRDAARLLREGLDHG